MISKGAVLLTTLFMGNIIHSSQAQQRKESQEVLLTRRLLKDYVTSARPVLTDSTVTNVTLDVVFNQLLDIDKQQQVMTASIWLRVGWVDEYLTWNATELGIDTIVLSPNSVWMPDIALINNAHDEVNTIPVDKNVIVNSSGYVTWLQSSISKSQCTLFSLYFPFDIQTCKLTYASWTYHYSQIYLSPKNDIGDSSEFVGNGVWQLQKIPVTEQQRFYACCSKPFTTLTYYVVLERLSLYYMINLYIPCVLISFISLMVFYLPSDAGERTSFAVTMLLSLTVFMLVAADNLPDSSSYVPIISQYLTGTILLMGMVVFTTIISLQIHHKAGTGSYPPKWLKRLILTYLARLVCLSTLGAQRRKKTSYSLTLKPDGKDAQPTNRFSSFSHTRSSEGIPTKGFPNTKLGRTNVANCFSEETMDDRRSHGLNYENQDATNSALESHLDYNNLPEQKGDLMEEHESVAIKEEWHAIAKVLDRVFMVVFLMIAIALNVMPFVRYFTEDREHQPGHVADNS